LYAAHGWELVISGWNISIIAAALYSLAEGLRLSKRKAFWLILGCIWLYTLFKGWTQSRESCYVRGAACGTVIIASSRIIVTNLIATYRLI
jgi:competence protein ComEC